MIYTGLTDDINKLYAHHLAHHKLAAATAATYAAWNETIMQIIDDVHAGKLKENDLSYSLFKANKDKLLKGAGEGFKLSFDKVDYNTPDYALLTNMKRNLYTFAGAKTRAHLKEINNLLYDKDGKLVDKKWFKDQASQYYRELSIVNSKYYNWLDIEYDTAVAQATMAKRWTEFMNNKDVAPNLKYVTVGDDHVRETHRQLDGLIRPKDDPIWDKIYPIKDWGCRCDIIEVDEPATGAVPQLNYDGPFEGNVGKTGNVISKKHPYYKASKEDNKKLQEQVDAFWKQEYIEQQRKIYTQYKEQDNYFGIHFNAETGGYYVKHVNAATLNNEEGNVVNKLMRKGEGVVVPSKPPKGSRYNLTYDIKINEVPFEIKNILGNVYNRTTDSVRKAMEQAGNCVLNFDRKINIDDLIKAFDKVKNEKRLNTVIVFVEDSYAVITKKEMLANDYSALDNIL